VVGQRYEVKRFQPWPNAENPSASRVPRSHDKPVECTRTKQSALGVVANTRNHLILRNPENLIPGLRLKPDT
jgi:hypothetical protein